MELSKNNVQKHRIQIQKQIQAKIQIQKCEGQGVRWLEGRVTDISPTS